MADPRQELADIVVPAAPTIATNSGLPVWGVAAGLAVAAAFAAVAWWMFRQRFARALARIVRAAARRENTVEELAGRLDRWARARFGLACLAGSEPPPGVDANQWSGWVDTLAALRFAAACADGYARLDALCRTAGQWRPHA